MLAWGKTVDVSKDSIARTTSGNGEYYQLSAAEAT